MHRFNSIYQCEVESVGMAVNIWTKMCFVFYDLGNTLLLATHHADYITVVEDTPILSVKYCLPVPVFYFWRKL